MGAPPLHQPDPRTGARFTVIAYWWTGTVRRVLTEQRPGERTADFALRVRTRWPFLPPDFVTLGDDLPLLGALHGHDEGQTVHCAPPTPAPAAPSGKRGRPKGKADAKPRQTQGYKERYRQHWIDKNNAKRKPDQD